MFKLFRKKNPIAVLQKEYEILMKKSFDLSKTDRTAADKAYAEAEEIAKKIEDIKG